jgi:hypothetical protein
VDLALAEAPPEEARAAIDSAEALLYATARWIENGRDGRPERE